jgi:hypothetical protein
MSAPRVYVLGGFQTDFAPREGLGLVDLVVDAVHGALESTRIDASEVVRGGPCLGRPPPEDPAR